MTANQLQEMLLRHRQWLRGEEGGHRANLSGANLSGADLSRANLSRADLSWANLSRAKLSGANLSEAKLSGAKLSRADLSWANLSRAKLSGADLSRADLSWANLSEAKLSGADLSGATLVAINSQFCLFDTVKWEAAEVKAMSRLKALIPPDAFERYRVWGQCEIDGAIFGRFEWVGLLDGWYCTVVQTDEPLPPTDRLIHRLFLWRKNKEEFKRIANKQV